MSFAAITPKTLHLAARSGGLVLPDEERAALRRCTRCDVEIVDGLRTTDDVDAFEAAPERCTNPEHLQSLAHHVTEAEIRAAHRARVHEVRSRHPKTKRGS